ncbi:hypothetical protein IFM53868_09303, partial [Aspergillus udagawae]
SRRIFKDEDNYAKPAAIPGAARKTLDDAPRGGEMVTFERPNGTFVHGPFNTPFEKPRKGQFQRYRDGPALVHKLGHYRYVCKEFEMELEFYTIPQMNIMTFMHLDLGEEYTGHHTFFLQAGVANSGQDLMGQQYLAKRGWKSVWGVGRHILGSQIFDYLYDSSKFKIEHYADGDVVNCDNATRREPVGPLSVWGPELPRDFWG